VLSPNADAVLRMQLFSVPAASNQADSLRSALKPTQARTEALTINGLQATRLTGVRQNAQGTTPLAATLVKGPHEHSYLLQRNAKNAQILQDLSPQLREAEESFRAMNDKDRSAAKAWALKMVRYPAGGFAELSKNSPLRQPEQQLRLINGFYGAGAPKVGSLVKVVE
jgi:predicted Zn-dependent protease